MSKTAASITFTETGAGIRAWTTGVPIEAAAEEQARNVAALPCVAGPVALMPDVHWGMGATVGSVIPTARAIIPAAVGVDIGCGMMAVQTTARATDLPDSLGPVRSAIEAAVPHGRTGRGDAANDRGAWGDVPDDIGRTFATAPYRHGTLADGLAEIVDRYPKLKRANSVHHLGTLGTGNHFIELCLDEADRVWIMLHSGSRGVGNQVGRYFIELAKEDMRRWFITLPDANLAYLPEGTEHFIDYVKALTWAQAFAALNRAVMMERVFDVLAARLPGLARGAVAVNCHHNYATREHHLGRDLWITRKGAVRAGKGELGIIPGSMGARSFIVRGKGNPASYCSCSHGAGRAMSRTEARKRFTLADHTAATEGVECRKDDAVIDETPMAYKDIDAVMVAQSDLVEVVHTLRQVVCVKG